jgi:hypothetical protein
VSEFHDKLLYLSVTKNIPKKKNIKSKWKTKSFLHVLKSPLTKKQNKKARFLLYRDLQTLKTKSESLLNINKKKLYTKAWLSKPRFSSWLNFSSNINDKRQFYKKQNHIVWTKKWIFHPSRLKYKRSKIFCLQRKENTWSQSVQKKQFVWKKIQINLFNIIIKLHKDILFLEKIFDFVPDRHLQSTKTVVKNFLPFLSKQYQKRKVLLKSVQRLYRSCLRITSEQENKTFVTSFSKQFATQIFTKRMKWELKNFRLFLKKQSSLFQKQIFFPGSKRGDLTYIKNRFWKKTLKNSFTFFFKFKRKQVLFRAWKTRYAFKEIEKRLWSKTWRSLFLPPKIRRFKKPLQFQNLHLFKLLRFEQKNRFHVYEEKNGLKLSKKKKLLTAGQKITNVSTEKLTYRLSVRYNYRKALLLITNLKVKYLIERLLRHYFSLIVCVKLFWPLVQFKNRKFYRLIFPKYKQFNLKKKNTPWILNKSLSFRQKRYLYIGQYTNHLTIKKDMRQGNHKTYQKWRKVKKFPQKDYLSFVKTKNKQTFLIRFAHLWKQKIITKNKYLKLKAKVIQAQSEKRLFWISKELFISNLITTLTVFSKYLEPQPLADHIAKIISLTKKHAAILKLIKTILRTLPFKRGIGYRIALIGRINGANKSRTLYVKKLNRNRPRQTFSKNVNFAMAQARATIGAFGVKIWVYS